MASDDRLHEALRMLYGEHTNQGRHHDMMRDGATAAVVALAAALTGGALTYVQALLEKHEAAWPALVLTLPVVGIGLFGAYLARAHSNSNRQHVQIARAYRFVLQKTFEALPAKGAGETAPEAPTARKLIKWLADKLPETKQCQAEFNSWWLALSEEEACHVRKLLSSSPSLQELKTKKWCGAMRGALDKKMILCVARHDFAAIRDYGHARHNLKHLEGERSLLSGYVARGWMLANLAVTGFGVLLSAWIVLISIYK